MKKSGAILGGIQTLALATTLISASAFADAPMTAATATDFSSRLAEKMTVSYYGVFAGPSIGSPSNYMPNDMALIEENDKNRVNLQNTVSVLYKLSPDITVGPAINFNYFPVGGDKFALVDPAVKITHSKLINSGNFNMLGSFRAYLPTSQASQDKGRITRLRALQYTTYDLPGTKWTLGAYSDQNFYAYSKDAAVNLEAYVGPFISFQVNKATAVSFCYELYANHKTSESLLTWGASDPTDFMMGVSYDITPNININPFLQIYPGGVISLNGTQLGAYISAKLL